MRTQARLLGLGAALVALGGGCQTRSFDHGDAPPSSGTGDSFGSVGGVAGEPFGGSEFDGNFPDPATTRCGQVLGELPPIPGLASAWAVVAVPDATADGTPVEAGSVLLRLSEQPISSCGETRQDEFGSSSGGFGTTSTGGSQETGGRGFELMLGPDELELGVHEVAMLAAPRVVVYGDGANSGSSVDGTIELLHVDDGCMVGVVRGFTTETDEPFMTGGFVAQTCQLQCIPTEGRPC
ncbi:MAG: hypothetical protein ACRBN8_04905 [Nannocystales bacterium]